MSQPALAISPTVTIVDGIPTTLSTDLASHFGKRHDDVLRGIRNLCAQLPEGGCPQFCGDLSHRRAKRTNLPRLPSDPRRLYAAGHGLYRQRGTTLEGRLYRRL